MEIINDNPQQNPQGGFENQQTYQQQVPGQNPYQQIPYPQQPYQQPYGQGQILPHSNKLVWSILITIFCCLVAGVVSIIYSAQSNTLYNQYLAATDENAKRNFYAESERSNKTAGTWITVGIIFGILHLILWIVYIAVVGFSVAFSELGNL